VRLIVHLQDAQKLLQSAREFRSKEKSKSQKMWAGAFAKAANEEDDADPKKAVRFTSPNQSTRPSEVSDGSPSLSPDRGESEQRKLFAGATPFHKKQAGHADDRHLSSPDATMLLEEEADVSQQSSWTPWLLGAGVVALAGAAAFVYASRSSRR
jgi:cell wall-associated NlpC family hydrolase